MVPVLVGLATVHIGGPLPPGPLLERACPVPPTRRPLPLPSVQLDLRRDQRDVRDRTRGALSLVWRPTRRPPYSPPPCERARVAALLGEHRRALEDGRRIPPRTPLAAALLTLRLQEIEATLDALTGGGVSGVRTPDRTQEHR